MREHEPTAHCPRCGSVTAVVIHDHGLSDNGDAYSAVWSEAVPHKQEHCEAFTRLERETWPTLW
jgi:hypothetical protein